MNHLPPLIDRVAGQDLAPTEPLGFHVTDSNTGENLQNAMATHARVLEQALVAAESAYFRGDWSEASTDLRAHALDTVADSLEPQIDRMASLDAQTTGITLYWARKMAALAPLTFRLAAQALRDGVTRTECPGTYGPVEVLSQPLGPVALIAPWNAPSTITAHKLASALAAGCPVILKPSEHAPHTAGILLRAIQESNVPKHTVQLVHGDGLVGKKLVADPRIKAVSFTGGLTGGRAVASACARDLKPVQLELGGNNPMVVLQDADVDQAAAAAVAGMVTLNGQWCRALGRLLVHSSLESDLVEGISERLAQLRIGHSMDPDTQMGPLAHQGHLATVCRQQALLLRGEEWSLVAPSNLPELGGFFHAPTLVRGVPSDQAWREIFGPVATLHRFDSEDEAVRLANQTPFGLAAYVFGEEQRACRMGRRIHAGSIKINGLSLLSLAPTAPRPAWGLSGLGEEGTVETLRFFTGNRVIGIAGRREAS